MLYGEEQLFSRVKFSETDYESSMIDGFFKSVIDEETVKG